MALAKTIPFSGFVVKIGDGATPEVYSAPCAFNTRALNRTKNLQETVVPDCADEDAAAWVERDILSMSWNITGEGVMDEDSVDIWDAFFDNPDSQNIELIINFTSAKPTISYLGAAHLQTLTYGASRGERVTFTIDMIGDGPLVGGAAVLLTRRPEAKPAKKTKAEAEAA